MKRTKDVSDEDEYSADDPEEVEGASEEEWTPEAGPDVSPRYLFISNLFYFTRYFSQQFFVHCNSSTSCCIYQ